MSISDITTHNNYYKRKAGRVYMSVYVCSDIHGMYDMYIQMLKKIGFKEEDTLYILGDVIDRGNRGIDLLLDIMSRENVVLLLGNHELMFYEAVINGFSNDTASLWFKNGGRSTVRQFMSLPSSDQRIIVDFISHLPIIVPNLTVGNKVYYLAHATYAHIPGVTGKETIRTLNSKELEQIVWAREYPYKNLRNNMDIYNEHKDKILIVGHTSTDKYCQTQGKNSIFFGHKGHFIGVDCGCTPTKISLGYGRLGCLRLNDYKKFYI